MYTLDIKKFKKTKLIEYFVGSLVSTLVTLIYSFFGHGVTSNFMNFMFIYPVFIGTCTTLLNKKGDIETSNIFACMIWTITLGSFTIGVLQIAGADSQLTWIYAILSVILFLLGTFRLIKTNYIN